MVWMLAQSIRYSLSDQALVLLDYLPVNIVDTYSTFGQIIILIILNIGGIGVMAIGTVLWVVLGKHIGIRERQLIMLDNNKDTMSGTVKSILEIIKTILTIEFIGALLLAFYFYRDNPDLKMHSCKVYLCLSLLLLTVD